ncbi:MAG: formate dehydrogenase accessory protein FdhE [Methylococcaceae bacterium]
MSDHPGAHAGPIARFLLPQAEAHFTARARRFRILAETDSPMSAYLALMADLSESQREIISSGVVIPSCSLVTDNGRLDTLTIADDPTLITVLRHITAALAPTGGTIGEVMTAINNADPKDVRAGFGQVLLRDFDAVNPGWLPFLASAVQVVCVSRAQGLDSAANLPAAGQCCPVCEGLPLAANLHAAGNMEGLRYLVCAVCATEWHRPRITCVQCGDSASVSYYGIEGEEAITAEVCGHCKIYIKLMNRQKRPELDPAADDLASLALDVLLGEQGYQRLGCNLLLLPGV